MKLPTFHSKQAQGLSLVEVLVALGLLTVLAAGMMSLHSADLKRMASNRQMSNRDSIKALADRYTLDANIIGLSADSANYASLGTNKDGNTALDYCLNGPPAAANPSCPAAVFPNCCKTVTNQPFVLLDPADSTYSTAFSGTDAATAPKAITHAAPARYSVEGARCNAASASCPLELVTTFDAKCAGTPPAANCNKADQVFISYSLRGAAGITPAGGTPFKTMGPATPVLIASAAGGAGGAGGGVVLQLKCGFPMVGGASIPNSQCKDLAGAHVCAPSACPAGFTDAGVSSEFTSANAGAVSGNCVRTCLK